MGIARRVLPRGVPGRDGLEQLGRDVPAHDAGRARRREEEGALALVTGFYRTLEDKAGPAPAAPAAGKTADDGEQCLFVGAKLACKDGRVCKAAGNNLFPTCVKGGGN